MFYKACYQIAPSFWFEYQKSAGYVFIIFWRIWHLLSSSCLLVSCVNLL